MWDVAIALIAEFWQTTSAMAPYLLFGFLMAGLLSVVISPKTIEAHLGTGGIWPVVKASVFGVPLPLCSCGVIPVAVSLRKHGASKGATTAFLLSTPQTGVDSILVTYSLLGPVFAVFRPLAALFTGLIGGALASFGDRDAATSDGPAEACTAPCCSGEAGGRLIRALRYGFIALPREIGRELLVGLLIAGGVSAFIPENFFAGWLGGGIGAMAAMMLLGIPVYMCSTASVPVARAMIVTAGISPGAAFAFLVSGPATNAASIAAVWKVLGRRTVLIYLLTVALGAMGGGLLLDWLFTRLPDVAAVPEHHGGIGIGSQIAAGALLALLAVAVWPRREHAHQAAQNIELHIKGMTCAHCAGKVRGALMGVPGVQTATVDAGTGMAAIGGERLDRELLRAAIEHTGYEVEP